MGESIGYSVHVAGLGWTSTFQDGMAAGTTGLGREIDAIKFSGLPGTMEYRARIRGLGWTDWIPSDQMAGAPDGGKGLLSFSFRATDNGQTSIWLRASWNGHDWDDPFDTTWPWSDEAWEEWQARLDMVNPQIRTATEPKLESLQVVQIVRVEKTQSASTASADFQKSVVDTILENLQQIQCILTVGMIAVTCAETAGVTCVLAGTEPGLFFCAQTINKLGEMFPGQQNYPVVNNTISAGDRAPVNFPSGGLVPAPAAPKPAPGPTPPRCNPGGHHRPIDLLKGFDISRFDQALGVFKKLEE